MLVDYLNELVELVVVDTFVVRAIGSVENGIGNTVANLGSDASNGALLDANDYLHCVVGAVGSLISISWGKRLNSVNALDHRLCDGLCLC